MQSIVGEIVSNYGDIEITDDLFNEYIKAEKRRILNNDIKIIKEKIKNEKDINKKIELCNELTKLKKEVDNNGNN